MEATGHNSNENRGDTLENREKGGACTQRDSERMGKAKGKKRNADRSENLI